MRSRSTSSGKAASRSCARALVADLKARHQRQGMSRGGGDRPSGDGGAGGHGRRAGRRKRSPRSKANCLPGDASAYENQAGGTCHAEDALAHAQFGFGSVEKGDPPKSARQRYYSILYPLPRTTPRRHAHLTRGPARRAPLVDVIVLDTNTLHVEGSVLGKSDKPREDRLQMLWLRSADGPMAARARGRAGGIWKILAMHHPPRRLAHARA